MAKKPESVRDLLAEIRGLNAEIASIKSAPASIEENEAALSALFDDIREAEESVFHTASMVLAGTANASEFTALPEKLIARRTYLLALGSIGPDRIMQEARNRAAIGLKDAGKGMTRNERHERLQSALEARYAAALDLLGADDHVDLATATELPAAAVLGVPMSEATDAGVLE